MHIKKLDPHPTSPAIQDIEVLRGLAILMVIFQHRSILLGPTWSEGLDPSLNFWPGVDLFLVVSGFVIGRGLLAARGAAATAAGFTGHIVAFWIRRAWRIWPSLGFWTGFIMFMSLIASPDLWGHHRAVLATAAAIATATENIHVYMAAGGHDFAATTPWPFAPYWSLSLEEQFYLLLPLALLLLPRKFQIHALAAVILAQLFLPRPPWSLLWAIRSDALLVGVAIAAAERAPVYRQMLEPVFLAGRWRPGVFSAVVVVLIAAAGAGIVPFATGLIALLCGALVWCASYGRGYILAAGPMKTALVWVGGRSYALYLIHDTAFQLTKEIWAHLPVHWPPAWQIPRLIITAALLAGVAAEANYRLLETPARRHGARLAQNYLRAHAPTAPAPLSV